MTWIIVIAVFAVLLGIAGKPTKGGTNTNAILLLPAGVLAVIDALLILWHFAK